MVTYQYPRPAVAVDITIFRKQGNEYELLLIQRGKEPFQGAYALPGGFVNIDEDLIDAAARELREETQLSGIPLQQIGAFGKPDRDPRGRVISIAYLGQLPDGQHPPLRAGDDAARVEWFSVQNLPELAFDHKQIIARALERLEDEKSQSV